jgi:signal transduction histidine kinase
MRLRQIATWFRWRSFPAALIMTILLAVAGQSQAADPAAKRVLMLHSFGPRFKPWSDYEQYIRSEISRRWQRPLDFLDQSLVDTRVENANAETIFADYLSALYTSRPVDLIIAIGAPAAAFVQRYRGRLFPATPMVFTAVEQRRVQYEKLTGNDTVVAVAHDFSAAFNNILRVLPLTKTIAIVNGASSNETFWLGEMQRELAPLTGRVEFRWYDEKSFEDILTDAANLPPHSAIFWHLMNIDAAGVAHEANDALSKLSSSANAPIFSYDSSFFGDAIVGGPMHSVQKLGQITAAVAIRVLNGEKAGDIKTPPSGFAAPIFDWRQMRRWGIGERNLPPDSTVYFRELAAWERYSWQIALVSSIIAIQTALILLLLREHRRRHIAEVQSRQRMTELAHVSRFSTVGELTASIAHEINQPLGAILANAESAKAILDSPSPDIAELNDIVDDILRDDQRASEVIRRTRSLLKKAPFELKNVDLNDIARETIGFLSSLAIARKFELTSMMYPKALPILGDRIQLQQVILNLVVNGVEAMKDMAPESRTISIRTTRLADCAELSVIDHGPGIPQDQMKKIFEPFHTSKPEGMGMGLSIARTIVGANQGQILAENQDEGGACFRITIPLVPARS